MGRNKERKILAEKNCPRRAMEPGKDQCSSIKNVQRREKEAGERV